MSASRVLFGFHAVTARLRARPQSIREIYVSANRQDARLRDLMARAEVARIRTHAADDARLLQLSGHGRHQGVVAIVDEALPHVTLDDVLETIDEPPLLVVLDGVTDPHNLGACLRSADAFGAHAIVVPKDRSVGVNATVAKAASGAADTVPVITVTNLARTLRDLKARDVWVIGAESGGESLFDADVAGPVAWVLGAEGGGLRRLTRETCDRIVGIPLQGTVESLNVSVATGICLYAARRARASAATASN
jgi:23S rRNA (guanosine2251-2'-O)-methyltransferase